MKGKHHKPPYSSPDPFRYRTRTYVQYYGRSNWDRDARYVYQHLNNCNMIVWLNEAAGESPATIRAEITAMLRGGPQKATMAGIARSLLPWERAASLLFNNRRPAGLSPVRRRPIL